MKVLVIIPAYNEQDCIESTIEGLKATCPDVDFVVCNDGSTDATSEICARRGYPCLSLPINCGLAAGFQLGMRYARAHGYDAAVQFDADGQHLPEYIPQMAAEIERGANIVIASRILAGERPEGARNLGSKLISGLIKITSGAEITDPTSGMRMYDKSLIDELADGFDYSPEPDAIALFARKGKKVVEIPARMRERQGGVSYLNFTNSMLYMLRTCCSLLLFQWFR